MTSYGRREEGEGSSESVTCAIRRSFCFHRLWPLLWPFAHRTAPSLSRCPRLPRPVRGDTVASSLRSCGRGTAELLGADVPCRRVARPLHPGDRENADPNPSALRAV